MHNKNDSWSSSKLYERFMGRWSTLISHKFLDWLAIPPNRSWLDIGCGTGSLTKLILKTNQPKEIFAVDSSNTFISSAEQSINSSIIRFQVGIAQALDLKTNSVDAVVSGIMLNFVPQPETAIAEMMRVTKPDGQIGIFLWDYANGMEMLRYFWDAAIVLDESAKKFDEGNRFPLCKKGELESLVKKTNLKQIEFKSIEVTTKFQNFDDYWTPFLGNVGPAPSYNMSLSPKKRQQIENKLRKTLPIADDGSISMIAKAWAVKGTA